MAGAGFGEHLKREREMRGVSLEEIAGATRISTRFLEALETETWDRLPGGVFNRGFVRTIARFLGLEEESLLAEYALARGERRPPATALTGLTPQPSASPRKLPWVALAGVPIAVALAVGAWFGWQWISARRAELNAAAASLPAAPAPPSAPSSLWMALADSPASQPVSVGDLRAAAGPWSGPGSGLLLKLDATRQTALTITSDGHPAFAGAIAAGESRIFSASTALTIDAADAGAIRLELNGQALEPIGPAGQRGTVTLRQPSAPAETGGHD